ncbi:UNVERIFIED_CONTAM: hypothetical protein FKN15_053287 [Acipenser sinensis]
MCPNPQCRVKETYLMRAYAAKAQATRLANTVNILTAYLDDLLTRLRYQSLWSRSSASSTTLLQMSGLQGQALGRSLASLVVARRQLWLSQATVSLERRSIVYVLNLLVAVFLLMLDLDSYFIPEPRGEKLDFKISHPGLFRHAAPSQQDLAL